MKMKIQKRVVGLILSSLVAIAILAGFTYGRTGHHSEKYATDTIPSLVALSDFWDMSYDYGYNLDILCEQSNKPGPRIRSVSVYRFRPDSQEGILQDSILLNREGDPVLKISPYESGPPFTDLFILFNPFINLLVLDTILSLL